MQPFFTNFQTGTTVLKVNERKNKNHPWKWSKSGSVQFIVLHSIFQLYLKVISNRKLEIHWQLSIYFPELSCLVHVSFLPVCNNWHLEYMHLSRKSQINWNTFKNLGTTGIPTSMNLLQVPDINPASTLLWASFCRMVKLFPTLPAANCYLQISRFSMCQRLIRKSSHEYRAPASLHIPYCHFKKYPFIEVSSLQCIMSIRHKNYKE